MSAFRLCLSISLCGRETVDPSGSQLGLVTIHPHLPTMCPSLPAHPISQGVAVSLGGDPSQGPHRPQHTALHPHLHPHRTLSLYSTFNRQGVHEGHRPSPHMAGAARPAQDTLKFKGKSCFTSKHSLEKKLTENATMAMIIAAM